MYVYEAMCVFVCVKLAQCSNRTFTTKLGDDFCPFLFPELHYSVHTVGVLDPLHHPHCHKLEK